VRKVYIVLGPPAVGKTSYRNALCKWLEITKRYHVAWYVKTNGRHNFDLQERRGSFVKNVSKPFLTFVKRHSGEQNCVIDGFPRNLTQAKMLFKFFEPQELVLIYVNSHVADLKQWSYERQVRRATRRGEPIDEKLYHAKINRYLRYELAAINYLKSQLQPEQIIELDSSKPNYQAYSDLRVILGLPPEPRSFNQTEIANEGEAETNQAEGVSLVLNNVVDSNYVDILNNP